MLLIRFETGTLQPFRPFQRTYPTRTHSQFAYPLPYPTRAEDFYPTRLTGIPVPVTYPYDYHTRERYNRPIALARRGTVGVTYRPNVIWLDFRLWMSTGQLRSLRGKLTSPDVGKNQLSRLQSDLYNKWRHMQSEERNHARFNMWYMGLVCMWHVRLTS